MLTPALLVSCSLNVTRLQPLHAQVKILLSMFQVMDGLQGSFNLMLPLSFTSLLENLNFLMFSLPLDCVFPQSFHLTMFYRTSLPLLVELVLLGVAMFASSRVPTAEYSQRRKPCAQLAPLDHASTATDLNVALHGILASAGAQS